MSTLIVQSRSFDTIVKGVHFHTEGSIDQNRLVRLHSEIRNKNSLDKRKVSLQMQVTNVGNVVYSLKTDPIFIYGTVLSVFIPSKKSSAVINLYGNMSFTDLAMDNPNLYETDDRVTALDKKITELAAKIRRTKVLLEAQEENQVDMKTEFDNMVFEMTTLRKERQILLDEIELNGKLSSLTIEFNHKVQ